MTIFVLSKRCRHRVGSTEFHCSTETMFCLFTTMTDWRSSHRNPHTLTFLEVARGTVEVPRSDRMAWQVSRSHVEISVPLSFRVRGPPLADSGAASANDPQVWPALDVSLGMSMHFAKDALTVLPRFALYGSSFINLPIRRLSSATKVRGTLRVGLLAGVGLWRPALG